MFQLSPFKKHFAYLFKASDHGLEYEWEEETKKARGKKRQLEVLQTGHLNRCRIPGLTLLPSQVEAQVWFCVLSHWDEHPFHGLLWDVPVIASELGQ